MRALIIYANYKEPSFTSSIRDVLADTFHQNGHEVVIRDLYEIKFNPVLSKKDLESIANEVFPIDIMNEQKFIQWADLICFVYPVWWSGMPAILKGYIERVFVMGYAFEFKGNEVIPLLKNKKVAIFNTTSPKNIYQSEESFKALNIITKDCIFGFCGMNVVEHKYFKSIIDATEKEKDEIFSEVKSIVGKLMVK
ncbi:MAG: NAD(P)H-dependent oxidoreductase [Bacteroidales bacterium]|nr:NAD(P)H-dependent oxidoreductase [Bacteroidales bacterium]MDD3859275.1 NAD(P)H-dependent oxidoreductase [Bacteroidales bacterium]